jgi:hypothetical protein
MEEGLSYREIAERIGAARAAGREPTVVFDLDGTLYDNTWRTLRILIEYAATLEATAPEVRRAIELIRPIAVAYRVADTLSDHGITDPRVVEGAIAFWRARFFTNDYQRYDVVIPGAAELARKLQRDGAVLVYFTGRDAPNMLLGTTEALQRDGFPIGTPDTHLFMKPTFEQDDLTYKSEAFAHLHRLGRTAAVFDNEPSLVNRFHREFPDALTFHLNTHWAPMAEPEGLDPGVRVIDNFFGLIAP